METQKKITPELFSYLQSEGYSVKELENLTEAQALNLRRRHDIYKDAGSPLG